MSAYSKNILVAFFLFISLSGFAQNVDSAKKELNRAQTGKQKLLLTFLVGDIYSKNNNPDSSFLYLNKAINLATEQHNDSIVMESEDRLGEIASALNKFQESKEHLEKAIAMAKAANAYGRQMVFLIIESGVSNQMEQYELSIEQSTAALAIAIQVHDKIREAAIYGSMANSYTFSDKFDAALDYVNRSIKIADSLKDYRDQDIGYGMIVSIFGRQKKYKEALKYGLILDSINATSGHSEYSTTDRVNLAIIYKNMGEYDKAINIYHEVLKSVTTDTFTRMYVYINMGIALAGKGEYKEAQKYFLLCDQLNSSFHIGGMEFADDKEMASAFYKSGQLDSALYYGKLSEKAANTKDVRPDEYKEAIELLADIYAAKGDTKNAQAYYKKYIEIQDSVFADKQNKNIAEQETRLKLTEKDKALSLLAKENELNIIKGQRQAIALVLGAVIVIIIVVVYRRTLRKNALLSEQKQALTQQKEIIDAQVTQLEAAATMKARFLANISHELRTPVTLLTGMLEMVRDKTKNNEQVEGEKVAIAYNNSRKLQHMVEEILDLTKVENKITEADSKVKEIAPLLKRIVTAFETLVQKEQLLLEYHDEGAKGVYVSVDEDKFEKIFNNLVYNAVKFNKPGGAIKVDARLSADGKLVVITVSDSGIGIVADDLPHIFERFYQGAARNSTISGGMGIGLSLVKEFTELLGGTISVTSIYGNGTTFTLQFPVAEKEEAVQEAELIPMPVEEWEHFKDRNTVLVVEDNVEMRYYLREVLGDKVNVAEAGNGREALEWMAQHTPDLIISDMMMPEMDGREFITRVKATDTYNKIPVITLTALADMDNQLSMLQIGVDDYIVKPFNADELRIRVYNLLNNFAARRQFNLEPKEPDDVVITNDDEASEFREKIKQYVLANLKYEYISVGDLARELLISERQLFRLAKSLTGCSPAQLIKEVRLQKAYELLLSGDIRKIEYISKQVGFETTAYFSRQFLERFGKRPTDLI